MKDQKKKPKKSRHPSLTPPPPNYSFSASQADVAVFKALKEAPSADKYPSAARWYKHVATYEDEFATLEGDASKPYTVYGPEVAEVTLNPAKAPEADDDDVDLFGSDDEEEDAEAARVRDERLAEYRKKKEAKPKVAAKSVVTLDVKPWGTFYIRLFYVADAEALSARYTAISF
jgi:elongation factor 1-beta